jgi:hypothetical protein
MTTSGDNILE